MGDSNSKKRKRIAQLVETDRLTRVEVIDIIAIKIWSLNTG